MGNWAAHELEQVDFGDRRLNRRFISMVDTLSRAPTASLPQAFQCWSQIKAAYRFFDAERVSTQAILAPHRRRTAERAAGEVRLLVPQDTTALDFSSHRKTTGLGYLYSAPGSGLFLHSTMAVTTEGVPLGLLDQRFWSRRRQDFGKKRTAKQRPIEEKETYRWIEALRASTEGLSDTLDVVMVADREADVYALFAEPRPGNIHLLIRGMHDRKVNSELGRLLPTIEAQPYCGTLTVEVGRSDERPPRKVHLDLRKATVELSAPGDRQDSKRVLNPITLNVILAEERAQERGAAATEKPIRWLLLTTLPVEDLEAVRTSVLYYSRRWLIERFHYVLKQGCRVEELQLESAQRLERAVATYSLVAWRLLYLLYSSRVEAAASCESVFEPIEWQALYATVHQEAPPKVPPTLQRVVLWLARLGGFIARKHDGQPGVKVLWRGLRRLEDIVQTWRLAQSLSPPLVGNA